VFTQAPELHESDVQTLPSLQLVQAAPAAPHTVVLWAAPGVRHVPALSEPQPVVQQLPPSHRPLAQVVPFVQFVPAVHAPALLQESPDVQMLPSSQAAPVAAV
jgi:hypothetical protein